MDKGKFTSLSIARKDLAEYDEIRKDFCKQHGVAEDKVSVQMIINTGMTFYKQRMKYGTEKDRASV